MISSEGIRDEVLDPNEPEKTWATLARRYITLHDDQGNTISLTWKEVAKLEELISLYYLSESRRYGRNN